MFYNSLNKINLALPVYCSITPHKKKHLTWPESIITDYCLSIYLYCNVSEMYLILFDNHTTESDT